MAELKLLLGGRQSACFARYVASAQREVGTGRSVFFAAEADDQQKLHDKPLQAMGHNITVQELPDADMSGLLEYSDALDAYGKPTQVQADITLSVSHHSFEQLLNADLESTKLYLHVNMATVSYEMAGEYGGGEAVIETARFSLLQKNARPREPATSKILRLLYAVLAALIIIIIILALR